MLPEKLLQSLQGQEGFDKDAFLTVHASGKQVTSIRINPAKPVALDAAWQTESIPWCPYGRYLAERPSFTLDPLLHAGAYYVQEASSMFLWHALQTVAGDNRQQKVLDLCAAPGGKSTLLASYFTGGLLVSNEVIRQRVAVLAENIVKWGSADIVVTNNDPSHFRSLPGFFDVMVADAPCSGSGLFRKDPSAIDEWSEGNVQLCSQRQQRILADALPALKEDGILIYSTCSYSTEEDEAIADWLVTEMGMESCRLPLFPGWHIVETESPVSGAYGYRFYPHLIRGEGFYLAAFRKKTGEKHAGRYPKGNITPASRNEQQQVQAFLPMPAEYTLFTSADTFRAFRTHWWEALQALAGSLYLKKAGTAIGSIKGKDMIPSHELALGWLPLDTLPAIPLQKEEALQYLKRKEIRPDAPKGWSLVTYCGLPLGWVKVLPNRINNYYPAEWRILKE
jgi:16S rRNA C967 or C1407 C5-methylase (RsmB/RsmF family)/NOL1/NOP2/fmu family ribosome biogenesis protein